MFIKQILYRYQFVSLRFLSRKIVRCSLPKGRSDREGPIGTFQFLTKLLRLIVLTVISSTYPPYPCYKHWFFIHVKVLDILEILKRAYFFH